MTTARETLTRITAVPETARATKGTLLAGERGIPCAFGRGGVTRDKQEGDGCTPLGDWPLRKLYYRADRLSTPDTALEKTPISGDDGWCDDPGSSFYNQPVSLPFTASHEQLFRTDHLYDLMIPMGYNDSNVKPGAGSAYTISS